MGFGLGFKSGDYDSNQKKAFDVCKKNGLVLNIQDHGIASRVGKDMFINKNMFYCTEFFNEVIDHEARHSGSYTKTDLAMDLFEGSFITSMAFCLTFPKGFSHFIPFGKNNGEVFIDINQIIVYIMAIGLIGLFIYLINII